MKKETKFFIVIAGAIALLYFYSRRKQEEERKCENIVDPGHNIIVGGLGTDRPLSTEQLQHPWWETASAEEIERYVDEHIQGETDKEEEADDTSTPGNDLPSGLHGGTPLKKPIYNELDVKTRKANRIKGFICKQY